MISLAHWQHPTTKVIDDLNVYKANGPYGIQAKMLKETSNDITETM